MHREQRVIEQTRSHLTHRARQAATIAALRQRLGGKAVVTNATPKPRSWQEAVVGSRHAYRGERLVPRRKSRGPSAPLFVKRNDHIEGLTSLLTLGVRVLTVMELVRRRSLQTAQTTRPGVHPANKTRIPDKPTAERSLKTFADVSLPIIKNAVGEEILRRLTSRPGVPEDILQRLGLGASLSRQLEIQETGS